MPPVSCRTVHTLHTTGAAAVWLASLPTAARATRHVQPAGMHMALWHAQQTLMRTQRGHASRRAAMAGAFLAGGAGDAERPELHHQLSAQRGTTLAQMTQAPHLVPGVHRRVCLEQQLEDVLIASIASSHQSRPAILRTGARTVRPRQDGMVVARRARGQLRASPNRQSGLQRTPQPGAAFGLA
jgi:hypothetical protein